MIKSTVVAFAIFLLSSIAFAQSQPASGLGAPGCGAPDTKFDVRTEKGQHAVPPEPGKALVYFIQNDLDFNLKPRPTARMGVDGTWAGATHSNSYFYVSVDPGVHHLCASWQTTVGQGASHKTAAAHFTAEANGVYYFEVYDTLSYGGSSNLQLIPLDSDEGQLLANQFSFSISQPKK